MSLAVVASALAQSTDSDFSFELNPVASVVGLALLGFGIWVCVDASKYPDWAFERAGTKKSTWQIWPIVGGVCCGIVALIMGIIWFASKKAQVESAATAGAPPGSAPPGGPPFGSPPGPPPGPPPEAPPPPPG